MGARGGRKPFVQEKKNGTFFLFLALALYFFDVQADNSSDEHIMKCCNGRVNGLYSDTSATPPCSAFCNCQNGRLLEYTICDAGKFFNPQKFRCEISQYFTCEKAKENKSDKESANLDPGLKIMLRASRPIEMEPGKNKTQEKISDLEVAQKKENNVSFAETEDINKRENGSLLILNPGSKKSQISDEKKQYSRIPRNLLTSRTPLKTPCTSPCTFANMNSKISSIVRLTANTACASVITKYYLNKRCIFNLFSCGSFCVSSSTISSGTILCIPAPAYKNTKC